MFGKYVGPLVMMAGMLVVAVNAQDRKETAINDHIGAYNFMVEIAGINAGFYHNVSGIQAEIEVIEYEDGDGFLRKRPGRTKYSNVTLKRGLVTDPDDEPAKQMLTWYKAMQNSGDTDSRHVTIHLVDMSLNRSVKQWELYGCWPSKWKISGLDGKGTDVAMEEITLAVEEIRF